MAYVGRHPIRNVAPLISKIDAVRAHLRPFLSPILPQNTAPTGRIKKERAKTANVSRRATVGSPDGMKTNAMTVAKYE